MRPAPARAGRFGGAALLLIVVTAGCTSSGQKQAIPTTPPPTSTTTPVSTSDATVGLPTSVPPTTRASCPGPPAVATWSLGRRASELIAAPILSGNPAALSVAAAHQVGGVLLLGSVPPGADLIAALAPVRAESPPVLVMSDEEGGGVQRLVPDVQSIPWARQMAQTMSSGQVQALARSVGVQMRSIGVDADLAPVLDLDGGATLSQSDPDGPRSFSTDPATAAAYGLAFTRGLEEAGVLSVVKHFPGLGQATGNTDYGPASTRPLSELEQTGLVPFRSAVAAGAKAVMVANASVPGLTNAPASVSPAVINGLLRQQLGFRGLVVTDSLSAGALTSAGYTVPAAAVASIEAGSDMILFGSTLTAADTAQLAPGPLSASISSIVSAIQAAVTTGHLTEARLDQAVSDVLAAKGAGACS